MTDFKRCRRCSVVKQISDFHRNRANRDGLQRYCKHCQVEVNRRSRLKNREKNIERHQRYFETHVEQERERRAEWKRLNRDAYLAHKAVWGAIKRGKLTRPKKCERCGSEEFRIHAHHEDYSKRLEVAWLCSPCHAQLHIELQQETQTEAAAA